MNPGSALALRDKRFGGPSRFQYVKWAARRFHDSGLQAGLDYLEEAFSRRGFRMEKLDHYQSYLSQYAHDFETRSPHVVDLRLTIEIAAATNVIVSGEIGRLDQTPHGYMAWLFTEHDHPDWQNELRMPLIQQHIADLMGAPSSEVSTGFYTFDDGTYERRVYSGSEITLAQRELRLLARRVPVR